MFFSVEERLDGPKEGSAVFDCRVYIPKEYLVVFFVIDTQIFPIDGNSLNLR